MRRGFVHARYCRCRTDWLAESLPCWGSSARRSGSAVSSGLLSLDLRSLPADTRAALGFTPPGQGDPVCSRPAAYRYGAPWRSLPGSPSLRRAVSRGSDRGHRQDFTPSGAGKEAKSPKTLPGQPAARVIYDAGEGFMDTSLAARRSEDIALDLLKFIASTTNVVRGGGSSTPGFAGGSSTRGEDGVTQLLEPPGGGSGSGEHRKQIS